MEKFYEELLCLAKKGEVKKERRAKAIQARREIMQSLSELPNGRQLADDFSFTLTYFASSLYWRGYKDALHHKRNLDSAPSPPKDREAFHRAVNKMLEENIEMTVREICERLDQTKVAATFDLAKNEKVNIGPDGRDWQDEAKATYVKQAIYRIRLRVRRKRRAKEWSQPDLPMNMRPT
jgi:hypothetical protein